VASGNFSERHSAKSERPPHRDVMEILASWYMSLLEKYPLVTKSLTASSIVGLSNFVSQRSFPQEAAGRKTRAGARRPINRRELLKYLIFGLLWVGPSSHYWQNALERIVPRRSRESRGSWALRKMLCDQLCFGPVGNVVFLSFIGYGIQGLSASQTVKKVRKEYLVTQVNGWLVWPLASVIIQYYLPIELRVAFLNAVAFFWSLYLMSKAGKKAKGA
jgi:hypothetical protein